MATFGARRLQSMISNTANILGIELLAAAQGIEFLRPLQSSAALEAVHALLRKDIPAHHVDRYLAPDMAHATQMVRDGTVASVVRGMAGLPQLWIPV
jgi:histidine ammonia-lyase